MPRPDQATAGIPSDARNSFSSEARRGPAARCFRTLAATAAMSRPSTWCRYWADHQSRRPRRIADANSGKSGAETVWMVTRIRVTWTTRRRSSASVNSSLPKSRRRVHSETYPEGAYCVCRPATRPSVRVSGSDDRSSRSWRARSARFSSRAVRTRSVTGRPYTAPRMPRIRTLTDGEVRRRRTAAQHLHRPRRRSAVDLVRRLTGIQAQSLPAARLAFPARTDGLTAERVDRARLRDRSIVHTWAMRGTLYLIAAEDYGWLVPLVMEPRIPNAFRRLEQEGVPPDQPAKAIRLIGRMLGREGPLTRPEIAERLRSGGIRTQGQALVHLLWLASAKGVICRGPGRGRDQCFVLVRDWIGEPEPMGRDAALAELAVRFLKAHGPSTPADLAMWSGIRVGDARRAWVGIEGRLVEVKTGRGAMGSLRRSAAEAPAGVVRLIPWWDEYLLGWKDRDLVAPPHQWRKINRDGGGWLNPTVLADGLAVGMWNTKPTPKSLLVEVQPFSPLSPTVRRGIRREAEHLSDFLGTPVKRALASGP
jgi:hypothetical protein